MRSPLGSFVRSSALVAVAFAAACSSSEKTATTSPTADSAVVADTEPTSTEPPATDPPATEPAATEPSATEPLATDPPFVADFSAIDPIVAEFVEERDLQGAGLIVVHRDEGVMYEQYWGEFDANRVSLIASSSKMISAGVLMSLDDQGLLDVDAPVAEVVDWGASNPSITPVQLISNSSGLVGLTPDPTYAPYLCQYLPGGSLQECAEQIFTTPDDDADVIAPDTDFRYGGAQWTVAGAVAEVASGKSWAELVEETFAEPCDLDSLAFNNHFAQLSGGFAYPVDFNSDPTTLVATDNPNPEGGAYVNVPDYGQLLLMHLRDGKCGDVQVLSPEAVDRMHADRVGDVYDGNARVVGTGGAGTGYGLGWWIDRGTGRLNDGGAYGTVPWLDLEDGYGVYLAVESTADIGSELASQLYDPVEAAITGG